MIEIMGGDPSLTHSGLCLPNGKTVSIKTGDPKAGDRRLTIIRKNMIYWLRSWPVRFVVLEDIPFSSKGNTAGAAMGHAIIRQVLDEFGIPVGLIVPATLKMFATGNGNADKPTMVMAAQRHGAECTDHNEADAWWLRQMGLWLAGEARLDQTLDEVLHMDQIRQKSVHGPWRKSPGAKWPDRLRIAAIRS